MCRAFIAGAAVMAAGAGSTGLILARCIGKVRKLFRPSGRALGSPESSYEAYDAWHTPDRESQC
jgi:hypothetical protein